MGNTYENHTHTHTNHQTQIQPSPQRKPRYINNYPTQRDAIQMQELNSYLIPKSQEQYIYQQQKRGCICCLSLREDHILEEKPQQINYTLKPNQLLKQQNSQTKHCYNHTNIPQPNHTTQQTSYDNHLDTPPFIQQQQDNASNISRLSQSINQFRESFRSDNSQTTIYLQPPQFILTSHILMRLLNRTVQQFFDFTEFLGWLTFKLFKISIYSGLFFLIINFVLIIFTKNIDCLTVRNNGIIELGRWLVLDFVVSVLVILFLCIHKHLVMNYKTQRRNKYLNRVLHIVQCSWIGLYCIKFFILNSLGSCQFFTYTYKHRLEQGVEGMSNNISPLMPVVQCPDSLSVYLIGFMVYNYISVLFLCLFVVDFVV